MRQDIVSSGVGETPHELTLVFNPNARKPRLKPPRMDALKFALGPRASVHVTQNLDELDQFMRAWRGAEQTLCFYGGDGSIARGLTSLIRHQGEAAPLPPVLAVRAGTINMLCSILGFHEKVDRTLERWNNDELLAVREIPLIKVEVEGQPPQYGFIFAWGVGYRVLREYYGRRAVPDVRDAVAVLLSTLLGGLRPDADRTELYRRVEVPLWVNGTRVPAAPMRAITLGTITRASLGLKPFPPVPVAPGGFHFSANGMSLPRVVLHFPTLLFGLGDQRVLAEKLGDQLVVGTHVRELVCELSEGFTMDGEMFELPARAKVRITPGPVVRFWTKK